MKSLLVFAIVSFFCYSSFAQESIDSNTFLLELIPVSKENERKYVVLKSMKGNMLDTLAEFPASFQKIVDFKITSLDTISYILQGNYDGDYFFSKLIKSQDGVWLPVIFTWIGKDPIEPVVTKEDLRNPTTYHIKSTDIVIRRVRGKEQVIDIKALQERFNPDLDSRK